MARLAPAFVCFSVALGAGAQPYGDEPLGSHLALELSGQTPAEVKGDPAHHFDERAARLRATFLVGGSVKPQRAVPLVQPYLSAEARATRAGLPWTSRSHDLLRVGAGGGVVLGTRGGESYLLGAMLLADADLTGSRASALRGAGLALGTLRLGEDVRALYGLVFGYGFGRGLLLPALGLRWRIAPSWTFGVLLPVELRLAWQTSAELSLAMIAAVSGDRVELANDDALSGSSEALAAGRRTLDVALSARLRASRRLVLELRAGVRSQGRIFADSGDRRVFDEAVAASGFASVRAVFQLSSAAGAPEQVVR